MLQATRSYYQKKVFLVILVFLVLRWITASLLELGNDESYYWLYSKDLRWNYFDHPPMVAVWVRLFTLNGWLDQYESVVRAGSVIGCAFATWFLYRAVAIIGDERSGWFAACLFNASLYAGIVAGVLVMPDSPQLFFWTFCLWQIARLINNDRSWTTWLLLGVGAGLCIMSKIHGVFILGGLGLFVLFKKREWLRLPQFYVSLLVSLVIISPIFLWNLRHDFMTWRFHSARVDVTAPVAEEKDSFWLELAQQILVNNPFNFLVIVMALLFLSRREKLHPALVAYNFIALPLALLLIVISLFRDIWYHWSGPAYTTLLPLAAIYLARVKPHSLFPAQLKWSTGFFLVALAAWPLVIHFYPGTYGSRHFGTLGKGDVSLDRYGWKDSGKNFAAMYQWEVKHGLSPSTPIVCPTWWGAHVEYYFGRPAGAPVIGLGTVQTLHHYAWLNAQRLPSIDLDTAYCITASIEDTSCISSFSSFYRHQQLITTLQVYRNRRPAAIFYVHRFTGWKGDEDNMAIMK